MSRAKTVFIFVFVSVMLFSTILLSCLIQERDSIESVKMVVEVNGQKEQIKLYKDNNVFYAFLPSYADTKSTYFSTVPGNALYIDGNEQSKNTIKDISFNQEHTLSIKNSLGLTVCEEKLIIMKSANISTISIDLADSTIDKIDNDKTIRQSGTINIIKETGEQDYFGAFKSIHSRGNASWNSAKKPYSIEFENAVDLLKIGAGKNWVLLANAYDATNMKNRIVLDTANDLGVRFCSRSEFVDLYINSEYRGLYLLAEKIEIGENRVEISNLEEQTQAVNYKKVSAYSAKQETNGNGSSMIKYYDIPNNPEEISGGYILKSEMLSRIPVDSYFVTSNGGTFDCESPKYATKEQMVYIASYFQKIEDSLNNYKSLSELIDIDSFVRRYLIQECFANAEGSSFYYIKDSGGKVFAEPVWDFDNALGTADTASVTGQYCMGSIYSGLLNHREFCDKVETVYATQMKSLYRKCAEQISRYQTILEKPDAMNKIRWRGVYTQNQTLAESTGLLLEYLKQRETFLDSLWIDKVNYVNIVFDDPENILEYYQSCSIKYGSCIDKTISLEKNGYRFLGWFDSKSGEAIKSNNPITEDHIFYAKWEKHNSQENNTESFREKLYSIKKEIQKDFDYYLTVFLALSIVVLLCFLAIKDFMSKKGGS